VLTLSELQQALDAVRRPSSFPPWWAISTLRPLPPPTQPPAALRTDLAPIEPERLPAIAEAPTPVEAPADGVGFRFDVEFQRRRWWWWRLKGSGWAGRLGR
jgi:hypothetical protein